KIAQVLTKANDTLSRRKTREEYDLYLSSRKQTLGARESIPPRPRSSPAPPAETDSGRPAVAPIDVISNIPRSPRAPSMADFAAETPPSDPPIPSPRRPEAKADAARR